MPLTTSLNYIDASILMEYSTTSTERSFLVVVVADTLVRNLKRALAV